MWRKIFIVLATLAFAFFILLVSVFRTASVRYDSNPLNLEENKTVFGEEESQVDYYLPFPGQVLPDSPLWPLKAVRDKLWLMLNTNPTREAELKLLFADKRLGSALALFERGKPEPGLSVLTKAEKYLEEAYAQDLLNRKNGWDTHEFVMKISKSALKHYEATEYILGLCCDEVKPVVIEMQRIPKKVYSESRNVLLDMRITPPQNPFNW